jgi:hypothetical protein
MFACRIDGSHTLMLWFEKEAQWIGPAYPEVLPRRTTTTRRDERERA